MRTVSNNPSILRKLSKLEAKLGQQNLSEILSVSPRYIRYIKENQRSVKNQEQNIIELYDKLYTTKKYKAIKKFTKQESENIVIKEQKLKFKIKEKQVNAITHGKQYIYFFKNKWSKLNKNFEFRVNYQYIKIIEIVECLKTS